MLGGGYQGMFRSGGICRAGNGARRSFASGATHARRCQPQRDAAGTLFAAALAAAAKAFARPTVRRDRNMLKGGLLRYSAIQCN